MPFLDMKLNGLKDIPGRLFVYVVGPDIGPKKIGIAKNARGRLSQYKTHNVQNVDLLYSINCPSDKAKRIEKSVHALLGQHRDHGEWFNISLEKAKAAIRKVAKEESQPLLQFAIVDFRKTVAFDRQVSARAASNLMANILIYPVDEVTISDGKIADSPVAVIRITEGDFCFLDFSNEGIIFDQWALAPTRYRRRFTNLSDCLCHAEEKIFAALNTDDTPG